MTQNVPIGGTVDVTLVVAALLAEAAAEQVLRDRLAGEGALAKPAVRAGHRALGASAEPDD